MGLFSKKPKTPEYDPADCEAKKKRLREIFNEAVKDGDTYEVMYAYMSTSKFERGRRQLRSPLRLHVFFQI